jgi:hypothetical protein
MPLLTQQLVHLRHEQCPLRLLREVLSLASPVPKSSPRSVHTAGPASPLGALRGAVRGAARVAHDPIARRRQCRDRWCSPQVHTFRTLLRRCRHFYTVTHRAAHPHTKSMHPRFPAVTLGLCELQHGFARAAVRSVGFDTSARAAKMQGHEGPDSNLGWDAEPEIGILVTG